MSLDEMLEIISAFNDGEDEFSDGHEKNANSNGGKKRCRVNREAIRLALTPDMFVTDK